MKFVDYYVIKIVRGKIFLPEVFLFSQGCNRREYYGPVRLFVFSVKETVIVGLPDVSEGYRRLLENLLPMGDKEDMFVFFGVERRKVGFPDSRGGLDQGLSGAATPSIITLSLVINMYKICHNLISKIIHFRKTCMRARSNIRNKFIWDITVFSTFDKLLLNKIFYCNPIRCFF